MQKGTEYLICKYQINHPILLNNIDWIIKSLILYIFALNISNETVGENWK